LKKKSLKTGFSTGTAAAAAAMGALEALLTGTAPAEVEVSLPQGGSLTIPVREVTVLATGEARGTVIKDAGDDPDVTHGAAISSLVTWGAEDGVGGEIAFRRGPGVGLVTRPGLPLAVGEPAINPVPREMIAGNLRRVWAKHRPDQTMPGLVVEVGIGDGERLARKTLNPRLGIVGGLSVLGTTGLVKPFSHEAYTATIESGLEVARAMGLREVVLTTGGKSEKIAMGLRPDLPEASFIQIADFFGFSLGETGKRGFKRVGLVSFFGKAVKQAQGLVYTHAHRAPLDLERLAEWLREAGADEKMVGEVAKANTARHALELLRQGGALGLAAVVGQRLETAVRDLAGSKVEIWVCIVDFDGAILYRGGPREAE
jgi:cobalt-precorrin-5B (C1)-methyltransferase